MVHIWGCPVILFYPCKEGDTLHAQHVNLSIQETKPGETLWKEDPEKIGAFSRDIMHINLYLPPEAFRHFWTAAVATDDASCDIEVTVKADHPDTLSVTNVGLIESMQVSAVDPPRGWAAAPLSLTAWVGFCIGLVL